MFLNEGREDFVEVSGVSGLDHPGDSRAFAILDYDRDGWPDLAVVNANAPLFQLYRNQMGEREGSTGGREGLTGGMVAVRFEGGNRSSDASAEWSARDGYGARVLLEIGGRTLLREHRAGEGLAAQNSPTMLIGVGDIERTQRLEVRWPSGRSYDTTAVPVGTLVTAYEDPSVSPTGSPFVLTPYSVPTPHRPLVASAKLPTASIRAAQQVLPGDRGRLIMYTTVATWCGPCLEELPALNLLRTTFTSGELEIFGVPYDQEETPAVLQAWSDLNTPPYQILSELNIEQRDAVVDEALDALRLEGLPAAIVTDSEGEVLLVRWGPPSISEIRVLLEKLGDNQ